MAEPRRRKATIGTPPPSAFPWADHSSNSHSRRSSLASMDIDLLHSSSLSDLRRPNAPFMTGTPPSTSSGSLPRTSSFSSASNMSPSTTIPRNASVHSFRAPFLAPPSRPGSSLGWSPPAYASAHGHQSPNASQLALPLAKGKPIAPSTRIDGPISKEEKPWLNKPQPGQRLSYFLTFLMIFLGIGGAAVLCWRGIVEVRRLDNDRLCLVMSDDFSSSSLDESIWSRDVELGGFGNGEFQMTTQDPDKLFLRNNQLYIRPTLTSDKVDNVLDGGTYRLDGCTTTNRSACNAVSNAAAGTVINPVQSARINTRGKASIRYGKVEIRAKLPRGDWLWPAIWMLPEDNTYGAWPASGEIDILEARGNGPEYKAQGVNFVRASLNYGPMPALFTQIFGWFSTKQTSYDKAFHVYTLEWTPEWMRISVDTRLRAMLDLQATGKGKNKSLWDRGHFPLTAQNGSAQVVVENPYANAPPIAPFDQKFYLIINLAVGGTSGWFPDNVGDKPWFDGSLTAMRDFAKMQDTWSKTWPQSDDERSFRIDSVKMWEMC